MTLKRSVPVMLLLAACHGRSQADHFASSSQGLTEATPPTTVGNPFPAMGATLSEQLTLQADAGYLGAAQCANCSFSNGLDPDTSATHIDSQLTPALAPPFLAGSGALASFTAAAQAAQSALSNPPAGVDNVHQTLSDIHDAFEVVALATGGTANSVQFNEHQWVRNFKPAYARNLRSSNSLIHIPATYPDPLLFSETTDRGARSYCAMRNAAIAAGATANGGADMTMLDNDLVTLLFWKVGYTHADATLMPISDVNNRWPGFNTPPTTYPGSQAFYIPVALGAQVAPLTGPLIPGFGELTHQLAWVTGDAEVLSEEDPVSFTVGGPTAYYGQMYRDLEHYDIWSGNYYDGSTGLSDITLMDLGFFSLQLGANLSMVSGVLEDPSVSDSIISQNQSIMPWMPQASGDVLYDYFGLNTIYKDGNWPSPRQNSFWLSSINNAGNYSLQSGDAYDDALGLSPNCASEIGEPEPFKQYAGGSCFLNAFPDTHTGSSSVSYKVDNTHYAPATWGAGARWRNDDDRSFVLRDSMDLGVNISGAGGLDLDIIKIDILATASLDVTSSVDTIVREDLSLIDHAHQNAEPTPQGGATEFLQPNLHVTPIGQNAITLNPLSVSLQFVLGSFPIIGEIDWAVKLFSLPDLSLAANPVIAKESDRLRVGEYSDLTSNQGGFPVDSHLPGGQTFPALPETVAQCLAENKSGGTLPQPPATTPAPPAPPYGLCFVGPLTGALETYRTQAGAYTHDDIVDYNPAGSQIAQLPNDICAISTSAQSSDSWDSHFLTPAQQQCMHFVTTYLCGNANGTSQESGVIEYGSHDPNQPPYRAIIHVVQKGQNPGEDVLTNEMWNLCTQAFVTPPGVTLNTAQANYLAQDFAHNFVDTVLCNTQTLEPVNGGPGTNPNNPPNCQIDPNTQQCWSFQPCTIDPQTGLCTTLCDNAVATCGQVQPVPTLCTPTRDNPLAPGIGSFGGGNPLAPGSTPCPPPRDLPCPPGQEKNRAGECRSICPPNEVLSINSDGIPTCAPIVDAGPTCPPNSVLAVNSAGIPGCAPIDAGVDAGPSCPPGYVLTMSLTATGSSCVLIDAGVDAGSLCPDGTQPVEDSNANVICVASATDGGVDAGSGCPAGSMPMNSFNGGFLCAPTTDAGSPGCTNLDLNGNCVPVSNNGDDAGVEEPADAAT